MLTEEEKKRIEVEVCQSVAREIETDELREQNRRAQEKAKEIAEFRAQKRNEIREQMKRDKKAREDAKKESERIAQEAIFEQHRQEKIRAGIEVPDPQSSADEFEPAEAESPSAE